MTTEVYAIASGKGGVGKTTTSLNVGIALRRAGHSVAIVDCDLGMSNLAELLDIDHSPTLHDVLAGRAAVDEALVRHADGFGVLPGDRSLRAYADVDADGLGPVVESVADGYDYVLVDTGPSLSYDDVLPLGLVDGLVLVTTPAPTARGDTRKTAEVARLVETPVSGVVVNRADGTTDAPAVAADLETDLLGVVPDDPAVRESGAAGESLWKDHASSDAAAAYLQIAAVLADGAEPTTAVDASPGRTTGSALASAEAASETDPASDPETEPEPTAESGSGAGEEASTEADAEGGADDADDTEGSADDVEGSGDDTEERTDETEDSADDTEGRAADTEEGAGDGEESGGWLRRIFG